MKARLPVIIIRILSGVLFPVLLMLSSATVKKESPKPQIPYSDQERKWVDSVFNALTPDQRLGQLFMVAAYSDSTKADVKGISNLIEKYNIGGLIFSRAALTGRHCSPTTTRAWPKHRCSLAWMPSGAWICASTARCGFRTR